MNQITTQTHVGQDGVIHLDIPTDFKDADVNVTITIEPFQPPVTEESETDELGWPIGFFERTAGALADDPITRPPQGEQPERKWPAGFFKDENVPA